MAEESNIELLDPRIQQWIWQKGWTQLRDAQERAVRPILGAQSDVIIAAATASGKTEAAFLPILTYMAAHGEELGLAIYISPLIALINDQWGRLTELCESMEVPVYPWHGDIAASKKQKFFKYPRGILLITPESLEAMFVRRGTQLKRLFSETSHIVIDELHAFIGTDRGKQMQSLLHRIEFALERCVPRVGLSATLGDMHLAADFLRPGDSRSVEMIVSESTGLHLKVQVRGYWTPIEKKAGTDIPVHPPLPSPPELVNATPPPIGGPDAIADHLYNTLRGSNNLVFPNSRNKVELYTDLLRHRCEKDRIPVEFWPHHGSLSRDIREETERALKTGSRSATAICTNTLELGIDIGAIKSVAQIGPGPSVASLRQRLGRSGRREGESAILRNYALEDELSIHSDFWDMLRGGMVQSIAMIELLLKGWFEPPVAGGLHLSTLVQQILSVIAETNGVEAKRLFEVLIKRGAFAGLAPTDLGNLLRAMAAKDLIVQDHGGILLLGELGESFVNHYEFYAAFASIEEWKIVNEGKHMGSIPITSPLQPLMKIVFAGRRWLVESIDEISHLVTVKASSGGAPPHFDAGMPRAHQRVREEMRRILGSQQQYAYLDNAAQYLLTEARFYYRQLSLATKRVIMHGNTMHLFTWMGDDCNDALVLILIGLGIQEVENARVSVNIKLTPNPDRIYDALQDIAQYPDDGLLGLLKNANNLQRGKWDWVLPDDLLRKSFASQYLSFDGARIVAKDILDSL